MINSSKTHSLADLPPTEVMTEAIRGAMREAVLEHARAGRAVAGWADGRVVWYQPHEILAKFGDSSVVISDSLEARTS